MDNPTDDTSDSQPTDDSGLGPSLDTTVPGDATTSASAPEPAPAAATPSTGTSSSGTGASTSPSDDLASASVEVPTLPSWRADDYAGPNPQAPLNFGHSARKLADSAVAPIVATARGYRTYNWPSYKNMRLDFPALPPGNLSQGRFLKEAVQASDVLIMPWYILTEADRAQREHRDAVATTLQYRPAVPRQNAKGKDVKYEFVAGMDTPLAMHPAIPREWLDECPRVLVAEGLLKGDAALSGFLAEEGGFSREDLALADPETARDRLQEMLASIPEERRVLILTIGGVGNWRKNNEWRSMNLKGREVWIGVDGDVDSNRQVYNQAKDMWSLIEESHGGTAKLLSPRVVAGDDGGIEKAGIDDYLSKVGSWRSLLDMLDDTLPGTPPDDGADFAGEYRISEDGTRLEFCKPETDEMSRVIGGKWETAYNLGGRISAMGGTRTPRWSEIARGKPDDRVEYDEGSEDCEVEISWLDADTNEVQTHLITGPAKILNYTPDQWERHGAKIPGAVLYNPEWPVAKDMGDKWLRAIKKARRNEMRQSTRWDAMGWVPTRSGIPAFVIGEQIVADDRADTEVQPGVTESELNAASRFGVGDLMPGGFDDESFKDQVKADIEAVIDTYVRAGAWVKRRKASALVGLALRPCLPVRPRSSCLLVGPRRKGKSFSAAAMMGFWARRPGDWTSNALPGSAKDSVASMELSVARSVIWVADDLAPATAKRQAEKEQDDIGTLIRNIFNEAAKGRANANMGVRKKNLPRALFVVTAENDPTISSVRDRCVCIDIGYGDLPDRRDLTDDVVSLFTDDGAPARVAQALIRFLQWKAQQSSWMQVHQEVRDMISRSEDYAAQRTPEFGSKEGDNKRVAELAADVIAPLRYLADMAYTVGADEVAEFILSERGMQMDVVRLLAEGDQSSNETSAGRSLMAAISKSLSRLACHVVNAEAPGMPPGETDGNPRYSPLLGWKPTPDGKPVPCGDRIGYLVTEKDGQMFVYLDQQTAFDVAQKQFPSLIREGSGQRASWNAARGEGFLAEQFIREGNTGRKMRNGIPIHGVPIPLENLLHVQTTDERTQAMLLEAADL